MSCARISLIFSDLGLRSPKRGSSAAAFSCSSSFSSFRSFGSPASRCTGGVWMAAPVPLKDNALSALGSSENEVQSSSVEKVGTNDLLIVGPGVLGRIVAEQWRELHSGCQVYGQTLTTDHHDELVNIGIRPFLKGKLPTRAFPYVIFCAPPSGNSDYQAEVRDATLYWSGEGSFVFTSSSAPYDRSDNGLCDEDTPDVPIGRSPRTDKLLTAEKIVLDAGGCIIRLAGLYKVDRGAHTYWLEKGTLDIGPDHILNLIHYEDAASISVAVLQKKHRGRIFLGCDNHPLSRQEIMDLVNESGKYEKKFKGFTGASDPFGKN